MTEPDQPEKLRRWYLKALGIGAAGGAAVKRAVSEASADADFEAGPVALDEDLRATVGYPRANEETVTETQDEVTLQSQVVAHPVEGLEDDDRDIPTPLVGIPFPIVLAATPVAEVDGEPQNELATAPIGEILADMEGRKPVRGSDLLIRAHVVDHSEATFQYGPEKVDERTGTMFGEEVTTETFLGVVAGESALIGVLIHAARAFHDGDAVFAYGIQYIPDVQQLDEFVDSYEEHFDSDAERRETFEEVKNATGRSKPVGGIQIDPPVEVSDFKLVQVVSDTFVGDEDSDTPDSSLYTHPTDPDLASGDNTAPMFDLEVEDPGTTSDRTAARFYLSLFRHATRAARPFRTESFEMDLNDLKLLSVGFPVKYVLARNVEDVPVFEMAKEIDKVALTIRFQSGYLMDSTSIEKGSDYTVRSVGPFQVGFISITDPGRGENYGNDNGRTEHYDETVASGVEYLKRVFPGPLAAFRWDFRIRGRTREDNGLRDDHHQARIMLDLLSGFNSLVPGTIFSHQMSDAEAESSILDNGFDAWMLIVPQGYYGYHDREGMSVKGYFPGSWAASVEETLGGGDTKQATLVAHELGHLLTDDKPEYKNEPNHPMAMRKDVERSQPTVDDLPVDANHARTRRNPRRSGLWEDDEYGVLSSGYDLTNGTFRILHSFTVDDGKFFPNPSGLPDPGAYYNPPDVDRVDEATFWNSSYMSYDLSDNWADSLIHSEWLDHPAFAPSQSSTTIIAARGRPTDDAGVVYDSVDVVDGQYRETDVVEVDVQLVEVSLRDPTEEDLERTVVSAERHEEESGDLVEGVSVTLPFPDTAVELVTTFEGTETRVNPIVRPIETSLARIPDRGFVEDDEAGESAGEIRERLAAALDRVREHMASGQYEEAAIVMSEEVRPIVADRIREEYDRFANQPTRSIVLDLVDRMIDRLETIAEEFG